MELAPSKSSNKSFDEVLSEESEKEPVENSEAVEDIELVRIKILEDADSIIDANGNEVSLEIGDVQNLPKEDAEWLIDAGIAKKAPL